MTCSIWKILRALPFHITASGLHSLLLFPRELIMKSRNVALQLWDPLRAQKLCPCWAAEKQMLFCLMLPPRNRESDRGRQESAFPVTAPARVQLPATKTT